MRFESLCGAGYLPIGNGICIYTHSKAHVTVAKNKWRDQTKENRTFLLKSIFAVRNRGKYRHTINRYIKNFFFCINKSFMKIFIPHKCFGYRASERDFKTRVLFLLPMLLLIRLFSSGLLKFSDLLLINPFGKINVNKNSWLVRLKREREKVRSRYRTDNKGA